MSGFSRIRMSFRDTKSGEGVASRVRIVNGRVVKVRNEDEKNEVKIGECNGFCDETLGLIIIVITSLNLVADCLVRI